ncbi:MAG TPA: ribosomal protein S18-alanine N-acetyltransferase [Thermoanaerobaculia bacterium]
MDVEGVTIAAATLADVPAIHRIEQECFPAPWRREFFEGELQVPGRLNLVARRDGVVIGYLFSMWLFDEMHVNKIAVTERARRLGIADALMARCLDFARKNSVESISLEVRQSNSGAQAFYRKLGFKATYVRPRYYPDGEAAVVMLRAV